MLYDALPRAHILEVFLPSSISVLKQSPPCNDFTSTVLSVLIEKENEVLSSMGFTAGKRLSQDFHSSEPDSQPVWA